MGAVLVMVALAGATVVARLHMNGLLSRTQLNIAAHDALDRAAAAITMLEQSHRVPVIAAFAGGTAAGWIAALWWSGRRLRRSPLLIADLRRADMPLLDGIRYVRGHASPPVTSDAAAMGLILTEAGRGRLTLWRRSPADTLRRVPQRRIRLAMTRMSLGAGGSWHADPWRAVMLLGVEVRAVWPHRSDAIL